jgi:hypothetical protein
MNGGITVKPSGRDWKRRVEIVNPSIRIAGVAARNEARCREKPHPAKGLRGPDARGLGN